jgi:hypothetical protein
MVKTDHPYLRVRHHRIGLGHSINLNAHMLSYLDLQLGLHSRLANLARWFR